MIRPFLRRLKKNLGKSIRFYTIGSTKCRQGMEKQQHIASLIEEKIRSGKWQPHDRLPPERQLAEDFGVSRNTLRTALRMLHGRGILGSRQGSGTYVEPASGTAACTTRQNLFYRLDGLPHLLPAVAALCAQRASPQALLELERLLTPVGVAVQAGLAADFAAAQTAFLRGIAHGADNPQLAAALESLLPSGRYFPELFTARTEAEHESVFACLARLLGAVRRKEPEPAASYAADYIALLLRSRRP